MISIVDLEKDVNAMLTSISSVGQSKVYGAKTGRGGRTQVSTGSNNFDSVTLSAPGQDNRFMDLVSKLSREVRIATTTGDIAALRQQVADRTYTPDPNAIAAHILMSEEGA